MTWTCHAHPRSGPQTQGTAFPVLIEQLSQRLCSCCGNSGGFVLFELSKVVTHQESSWRVLSHGLMADPAQSFRLPLKNAAQGHRPSPQSTCVSEPGQGEAGRAGGGFCLFFSPLNEKLKKVGVRHHCGQAATRGGS